MTPKSLIILAAFTAAAAAAAAASLNIDRGYSTSAAQGPVFPGLIDKADQVAKMTIESKDGEVVVEKAGAAWTVPAADGYAANLIQVQKTIVQVAQLQYLARKTAKKDLHVRLDLEDVDAKDSESRRLRLFDAGGSALAELVIGRTRHDLPGTVTEGVYIRKPGDPQTWLALGEIDVPTAKKDWLRKSILNIPEEDVLKLETRHPDGEIIRISKDDPKAKHFTLHGIPDRKKLKYETDPDNIANVVEALEMEDVRKADAFDFAADKATTATYTSRGGLEVDIWLVSEGEDDWLKLAVKALPDAPAPEAGLPSAAEIAAQVNERTAGWAFKVPGYKAERLRRGYEKMLEDKKSGS